MASFRRMLDQDLSANYSSPGLRHVIGQFLFNPGFCTVFLYRLASLLSKRNCSRLAILTWRINIIQSGCHLHPESVIGAGLCLPHATSVVIGGGVRIGSQATIYQSVTIGAKDNGYPTIGDHVTIYPNAVI